MGQKGSDKTFAHILLIFPFNACLIVVFNPGRQPSTTQLLLRSPTAIGGENHKGKYVRKLVG